MEIKYLKAIEDIIEREKRTAEDCISLATLPEMKEYNRGRTAALTLMLAAVQYQLNLAEEEVEAEKVREENE